MPRYLVLDGFCLGGSHGDVYPGAVVELTEREARLNLSIGRLRPAEEPPAAPAAPAPAPGADASTPDHRETKTTARAAKSAGKEE